MTAVRRWAPPMVAAALVTTLVLVLMHSLVTGGGELDGAVRPRAVLDFVRVRRDLPVEPRRPPVPPRPARTPPAGMPRVDGPRAAAPSVPLAPIAVPHLTPSLAITGAPTIGPLGADGGTVPLLRIDPHYPPRAQARGVEGWVRLRFTITAEGTTRDVEIVGAEPPGWFERAAARAVERYKYTPRIEGGVPVESPGQEVIVEFRLEE